MSDAVVAVIGEGVLADGVSERLSGFFASKRPFERFANRRLSGRFGSKRPSHGRGPAPRIRALRAARRSQFGRFRIVRLPAATAASLQAVRFALVLQDEWNPTAAAAAEQALRRRGIPRLHAFLTPEEGIVGPLVRPGTPGCPQCADSRRLTAGRDREMSPLHLMQLVQGGTPPTAPDAWGLRQTACLAAEETLRFLSGKPVRTEGRLYIVDLNTLACSLHRFQPDSLCEACGQRPDDSPDAARIALKPSLKASADSYRCRTADDLREMLAPAYMDRRTGLFNRKTVLSASIFADVSVNMPFPMGDEVTAGRSHFYLNSESTAMMEGLERYSGLLPRGKRTVVRDSHRNLSRRAPDGVLDPFRVGLYTEEQYAQPEFPFQRYDHDRAIDWVWGYSFLRERPMLVPELLAYYSMGFEQGFVNEGSNGCALGGSLEEAILHGILEVVERDSFLMTWYARLPVPRLDPFSPRDAEWRLMLDRFQTVSGFRVQLFNTTMEHRIPSVWAVAVNPKRRGIRLVCTAGAHLDPMRAAKSALHELAGMLPMLDGMLRERRKDAVRMFNDPSRVRRMEDHAILYGLPQARERLQFLLDENRPLRGWEEEFPKGKKRVRADLKEELTEVLRVFKGMKMDVIVIDQTPPEVLKNGLYCVKVLIPGMLPMTFGHHLTRLTGLERVFRVPKELGYTKRLLTPSQINPHPHPFP